MSNKKYHQEYYLKNKDKYRERSYRWRKENPERVKELRKKRRTKLRKRAMKCIGELMCINCGCDVYQYLEINHKKLYDRSQYDKNGYRKDRGDGFMRSIIQDEQAKEKYEITCRACNALHYLENKFPELPNNHTILWKAN